MTQNRRIPTAALWLPLAAVAWAAAPAAAQVIPEPTPVGNGVAYPYFRPTFAASPRREPVYAAQAPSGEPTEFRLPSPVPAIPVPSEKPTAMPVIRIPDVPPPSAVEQADCKTCRTLPGGPSADLLAGVGGPTGCYPGRDGCSPSPATTTFGRFVYGLYECACCPDPCYEPKWSPVADAAFFTPSARPVTHTRFRGRLINNLGTPDRAEWFYSRGGGTGRGPRPVNGRAVALLDNDRVSMYNEAATGKVGVFSELTYHRIRPDVGPGASGFGDLTLGTKTLLHDCELFQIAFQMSTTLPTGNFSKGLGGGHLVLEPSLILGLKLSADTFFQAQVAEHIPIAGDPEFAGSAMRYSFALNHVLCRPLPDCPVVGTLELAGITFQDGAFTDPDTGLQRAAGGSTYLAIGPGLRAFICDKVDLGIGTAFGIGDRAGPRQEYRIELRVRF